MFCVVKGGSKIYALRADHLGSTSVTADETGTPNSTLVYKAWGETRASNGDAPTDYDYTGQRNESAIGLYFYNVRWYDPVLGRFTQPDTIVPNPGNPMGWDRYAYVNNNSLRYNDPIGQFFIAPLVLVASGLKMMTWDDWVSQKAVVFRRIRRKEVIPEGQMGFGI